MTQLDQWLRALAGVFPSGIPARCEWTDLTEIRHVLESIGTSGATIDTFFPCGGSLELTGAESSVEEGCIRLLLEQSVQIIRPRKLQFESFGKNYGSAYFRLETEPLALRGNGPDPEDGFEELVELSPGSYTDRSAWDQDRLGIAEDGTEIPLPVGARLVVRALRGTYVFFSRCSAYVRQVNPGFDGRHSRMTAEELRCYIADLEARGTRP